MKTVDPGEVWGTVCAIKWCRERGIRPPTFHEVGGSLVVTFRVPVGSA